MSASAASTAAMPAWKLLVIGAVGLLGAGVGLALGIFLLGGSPALGAGASYVPADAPFYVEMRLEPSAAQDEALRELLGHFPAIDGLDPDEPIFGQLTEHLDGMLNEEGAGISWAEDVAPWFDGRVALAVIDIPASAMSPDPTDPMAVPDVPVLFLAGVTDPATARDSIQRIIDGAEGSPTFIAEQHAGVTIHVSADVAYAVTDDQLLVALTAADVRAAIDTRASGSGTMADVDEITRLTETLPSDWLAFVFFDLRDLVADAFAELSGEAPETAAAFEELLSQQSLRGAMTITAGGDRLAVDSAGDPPTGPFAPTNADRGFAAEVPADTLYFSEAGNLGATLAAVIGPMKEAFAAEPELGEGITTAEMALGADLEELVAWIGEGAVAIGWDGAEPYGGLVLVPLDVDEARDRLGQLATFATLAALDPSTGLSVSEREIGDVEVTTIRWEDPNAMPDPMFPAPPAIVVEYALIDDRALIGFGDAFVERVLGLDAADSLASEPRFADAVDELGGSNNAGVTWLDLAGAREALEDALLPMAQAFGVGPEYETDIQPWLLPLDRWVAVTRLEGDVLIQRAALLVE